METAVKFSPWILVLFLSFSSMFMNDGMIITAHNVNSYGCVSYCTNVIFEFASKWISITIFQKNVRECCSFLWECIPVFFDIEV